MASAEPSPLASSVEKTNGSKLSRLLIDGGTRVLRNVFDNYHPPSHLKESLNSHYSTLNEFRRNRILNNFQWYKLFPAGGAIPDSKNFDISLLFLLLTSICGLSPPDGEEEWNNKPRSTDHSPEANLLRIKFFRNELYGHVTTTGIDTPKFNAYWRKISGALRGLGLDKAEIDRLKLEHCGEQDYIDLLCKWCHSELDIKIQLEGISRSQTAVQQAQNKTQQTVDEVRQSQTKTQQTVDEVRQSQTKTQRTVDEVRQSQTKTQQTVDEVRQSQIKTQQTVDEIRQSQTKTQQTVDEVRQSQTKTQQTVDEVRQSQTKTQQTVDEVRQSQTKTQQTVDEVRQSQTKTQQTVDEVRQSQTKTQQTVDEVRQSQIKTQQTVDEVRQSQTKTQQTVDEVRQSQTKTQQTVDEVRQSQTKTQQTVDEVRQSQTKTQQTVDEVLQSQTKTQQTVDEVRQNQLEDRGTIQDSNTKLQEVFQMDRKTHQVVRNVRETQIDDSKAIQDIRHTQHEFHKTLQETQSRVEEIQQTQEKLLETQDEKFECLRQDLKQTTEDLEGQKENHRENEILKKLAKIDTVKNVRQHRDRYVEGTRLSIFAKVESWLNDKSSPNRVMVITGNAGMGKSVISAVVCEKMQEAGRLAGSHFFQHDRARHRNPKVMLQSLASQLCDFLPDYKKALAEKLSRNLGVEINNMEVKDLFEVLFEEPLTSLNDPGLTYLMVIDGLDESEFQGRNELPDVIANYFQGLPLWIRCLVTTRPEINIAENLKNLRPLKLDPNVKENLKDIHLCFETQISHLLKSEHRGNILHALVQKSEGVMLYAHYLVDFIKMEVALVTPELLDSILPSGISSVYHSYFKRLETELCKELEVTEEQFLNFLSAFATAREPLPLGSVSKLLLPGKSTSVVQRKIKAAIAYVSALLPVQDECIHFFHKSVKDWLIDKSNYGQHHFSVAEKDGHEVLTKLSVSELDEVKRKGVDFAQFSDTTKYALQHGVQHMLQLEDARVCSLEEVVKKFVLDVELVYAKLCVNVTAASEDIVCVQKQAGINEALLGRYDRALNTLLLLLRKHIGTLEELPHTIFQTLLNKGGDQFSPEASTLLENKYPEMAFMEYLQKEDLQGLVRIKFRCSAAVVCFDVSPQLDYMVCECLDRTIQLWSLRTGGLVWKREVEVEKDYYYCDGVTDIFGFWHDVDPYYEPYRTGPSNDVRLLFRSVVFHPTEDLVLPGILSHAYTFDGDLKPLFLSSKCRFWVCSISADKIKMLTDCRSDTKSIIMWSLTDGSEINRLAWNCDISSFAWSRDGRLLTVSDQSGSITLVDVLDGFKTLALRTLPVVCGIIKLSTDCRWLYCLHLESNGKKLFRLDVNMKTDSNFSLDVLPGEVSYHPWEFESCSETGFLLGDPFWFSSVDFIYPLEPGLAFVLNKQSILMVHSRNTTQVIEMLQHDELPKDNARALRPTVAKVVLSLNGDTLYVAAKNGSTVILMAWDISNGMFKPGKRVFESIGWLPYVVAVAEGVLLETSSATLELWNCDLSMCIRSWTGLGIIKEVNPISDVRVACDVGSNVIILDTTTEGIVSTFNLHGHFMACNSKCHVMTVKLRALYSDEDEYAYEYEYEGLEMRCGDKVLWKISEPAFSSIRSFSPTEQYCVLVGKPSDGFDEFLYVLDAVSGKTLHMLCSCNRIYERNLDCKFVSDEECVTYFGGESTGYFLQLFNVKSGDLLSKIALELHVYSLAACPRKGLVALGFLDYKVNFKVLQVKLPRDEGRKRKRIKHQE